MSTHNYSIDGAVHYHYDAFPPAALDYGVFVQELVKATEALARYDQMLKGMHNPEILLGPLRNQEAVLSSRMEGTISTIDEILQYEADYGAADTDAVRSDVIETFLYQRTLKDAQGALASGYGFSLNLIRQMHQQLLSVGRGADKAPGALKTEQNYLADRARKRIQFVPVRPEKLTDGLETLFQFLAADTRPVLVKTALMHLEFEALHPFKDGNGRIGRMLITLYLWQEGILSQPHFYISGYFEEHKDAYIEMMRNVSKTGDWNAWVQFFLTAVQSQAVQNLEVAEEIRTLYEEAKRSFAALLSSKWSMVVVDYVFTHPVFRSNRFVVATGIPIATAPPILKKLVERGYLAVRQEASGRRAALYSFEPLLSIVRV